jgi:hypothetical protein
MINDELLIYRGKDYVISEHIIIHQPSLDEICTYGEKEYYQMIYAFTSTPSDLKWQLDNVGIDYTKISEFELFYNILIKGYSQKQTSILFGDLDFSKFELYTNTQNNEVCLAQSVKGNTVIIDAYTYMLIADYLRKMHCLKKNEQMPANESTKQILIEDARDEYMLNKDKEYHSQLVNLISSMINSEGFKFNHNDVWSMKINAFMDSVKRISKIKNAELLLQSGYSGYGISFKDIDKKQIDWLGELE